MNKKHDTKIIPTNGGICVEFTDRYHDWTMPNQMEFESLAEVRQFAYELLETTMDFVIKNRNKEQ